MTLVFNLLHHCPRAAAKTVVLFSVDDSFVDGVPASGVETPVVGGVLVAIDSDLASLYFFVGINTHGDMIFII